MLMVILYNMGIKDQLRDNINEFRKEAERAKKDNSYNSAITLFFKAIAVLTDLFLLGKEGYIPSNHTERFGILKKKYGELYIILDRAFPLYQQTYRLKLGKEHLEVIENDFRKLVELTKIDLNNKGD